MDKLPICHEDTQLRVVLTNKLDGKLLETSNALDITCNAVVTNMTVIASIGK